MKKALIHDWLDKFGGAERVLSAIAEIMDFDYYYAYINKMDHADIKRVFGESTIEIQESKMLRGFKSAFRYLMPFFPFIVKKFNQQTRNNKVDLVISSSWALSKSYRIGDEIHICYLQARNFKYVWEEADQYFRGPLRILSFIKPLLRKFDLNGGSNPDYLIANSYFVQKWVKEKYGRDSVVIYPAVDVEDFFISEEKEDYYVTVGRLEPYKRFDIIVDAFAKNGKKLLVIGDGSQMKELKDRSASNITFLGYKTKDDIKHILSKAKAFVFSGVEDFGIAIVEALASGVPVIAFKGGASEELINTQNGMLYDEQSVDSLNQTIMKFSLELEGNLDPRIIKESANKFSKQRFQKEFLTFVNSVAPQVGSHIKVLTNQV